MPYTLGPFRDINLDDALLSHLLAEHESDTLPGLQRLWAYYRNPTLNKPSNPLASASSGSSHFRRRPRLAQQSGLPARFSGPTGPRLSDDRATDSLGKEVVIENDIAWRIHAMVDVMFGRPISIVSTARDDSTRRAVEQLLDAVFESSGGGALLQDMALLGCVYGSVDLLLRADDLFAASATRSDASSDAALTRALDHAHLARIELLDPTRAIPLVAGADYRQLDALVLRYTRLSNEVERSRPSAAFAALAQRLGHTPRNTARAEVRIVEIHSASHRQSYEDARLIDEAPNPLGVVPVVHIQNISQPFHYHGVSEVEPLIPLQDELNTRLSDRAARVTMQSFRMYLAKGIDSFGQTPVAPGQVYSTDNPDASITPVGGDAHSPSEDSHIEEIREALDKISSVTPVAAGVLRSKLGNLSSESALRVTLLGLLAKTQRKHIAYGRGLAQLCNLILHAFNEAGLLRTDPRDRGVRIVWPDPLPQSETDRLNTALLKSQLGVPTPRVLAELGYAPTDPGLT
jgi:hypothetical protein